MRKLTTAVAPHGRAWLLACAAIACATAGCANPSFPRGGPVDTNAPILVSTTPADSSTGASEREIEFFFDEVVSERPTGVPSLTGLFLISPGMSEPRVSWRRRSFVVRPREPLLPNTTYTITMLPGVVDLQNNARKEGQSIVFSTGGEIHSAAISGIVFDWSAETPLPRAVVQAAVLPAGSAATAERSDSTFYSAVSDSTGRFTLRNLPDGVYDVRAFQDGNSDRRLDAREMFDSIRVTLSDSASVELLAFVHDSIAPHLDSITVRDSFTLVVRLTRPVTPSQTVDTSAFRLISANDSSVIPLALARPELPLDRAARGAPPSARTDSITRADSIAAAQRPDSLRFIQAVVPSRPRPPQVFIIQTAVPLQAGARYILRATGLTGMTGTSRDNERSFAVPARPPPAAATPPGRVDTLVYRRRQ